VTEAAAKVEASTHYSPSMLILQPGASIELRDFMWALRELAVYMAGPISNKMSPCATSLEYIARHEACHCLTGFMLGQRFAASIVAVPGHSAGRVSRTSRRPLPGEPSLSDEEQIADFAVLGGGHFDVGEVEAFVTRLLDDFRPLVRRLTDELLRARVLSARRVRQVLFRAMRKDWRRARALQERDRREQARSRAVLKTAVGARSPLRRTAKVYFRYAVWALSGGLAERFQPFRRSVADHEAGHGVIGLLVGFDVISVSIIGGADARIGMSSVRVGCCTVASPTADLTSWPGGSDWPGDFSRPPSTMLSDRQLAARCCMAASALSGRPGWRGALRQYRRARDEAKRLVDENMPLILKLSQALALHRELDREQIARILGSRPTSA
jgi:hypothetical protein